MVPCAFIRLKHSHVGVLVLTCMLRRGAGCSWRASGRSAAWLRCAAQQVAAPLHVQSFEVLGSRTRELLKVLLHGLTSEGGRYFAVRWIHQSRP